MTDEFADIRDQIAHLAVIKHDGYVKVAARQMKRLLAAIDERDKRIAELEANGVDHCDSCSCNYDPTVTR